ncbi:hypothetical protein Tco_0905746, partial [Tanacetum coccineum]
MSSALIKQYNERCGTLIEPIRLSFSDEDKSDKGEGVDKGAEDSEDEDLQKPYKEVLKSLFTRRIIEFSAPKHRSMTASLTRMTSVVYNVSTDPRWSGKRLVQPDAEWLHRQLADLREEFIERCLDLARRFSDQVPRTMIEMIKRVDDFIKSEEVYKSIEFPRGEFLEKGQGAPSRENRLPRAAYGGGQQTTYDNRRQENNHLSLDSLTKWPKEILVMKLQQQLPPCPSMVGTPNGRNILPVFYLPMASLLKITLQAPFLNDKMMSDHNSSDLAP